MPLQDYALSDFTHAPYTRPVYRRGSGPAVIIMHEIPGLHAQVVEFADRVAEAGMTVFLPSLFRPMQKFWRFALTMLLLLVAVEAVQLLLACGSCDVDDVLLNLAGTLIVFGILKLPFLQRLLKKLYLLPEPTAPQPAEAPEEVVPPELTA